MSSSTFKDEYSFSRAFAKAFVFLMQVQNGTPKMKNALKELQHEAVGEFGMADLFMQLITVCAAADKPIALMIDEVDSASNNQVFLDFLAQLRGYYITRDKLPTFQSVILAGVHDIRNLQLKIRSDSDHKHNFNQNKQIGTHRFR